MDIENKTPEEILRLLRGKNRAELEAIYGDALSKLPSRAPIYTPTDKIPLTSRITGVEHVRRIYRHDLDAVYRNRLRALREQYKGTKRCFLIGNGPSLNRTDLSVLKDEVTFAVNGFFLKAQELDWRPTFYCVEDHLVAEDRAPWINQFKGSTKLFPAYLGYMFPPDEDTIFYNHRPRKSYPHGFDFSMEADKITYTGCTVTFSIMQLAAYLGFEEIYLIGVDASYQIPQDVQTGSDYNVGVLDMKSDDPNHFNPDYFGKGFRWHDPQVHLMVEAYKEARLELERAGTGQKIYNATVGGELEVFERRSFGSLFPHAQEPDALEAENKRRQEDKRRARPPRMLVIDMTAAGSPSATGQIKAKLLREWADADLLQVSSPKDNKLALVRREGGSFEETAASDQDVTAMIEAFDPEVVLYRPLADRQHLHRFAMEFLEGSGQKLPLVTWIMDDWPARLEATGSARFRELDRDLRHLLNRSVLRLSICDAMSHAFAERYNVPFKAYANGIDPAFWAKTRRHSEGQLLLRYSGALAPDMGAESVLRVAQAVEELIGEGHDLRFEINTQSYWKTQSGHLFESLKGTTLDTVSREELDYQTWMQEADALLIAYNFDPESLRYVRYSMANKLPECLASGAALMVHGPREIATVDYAAETGAVELVLSPDLDRVKQSLLKLMDPKHRDRLATAGRSRALERHSLDHLAKGLATDIAQACSQIMSLHPWAVLLPPDGQAARPLADLAAIHGELDRNSRLLAVYDTPEDIAARAMADEGDVLAALETWVEGARACIAVFRDARGRVLLLPRRVWASAQEENVRLLEDWLPRGRAAIPPLAGAPKSAPEFYAMACLLIESRPHIVALLQELKACSHLPKGPPSAPVIDPIELITAGETLGQRRRDLLDLRSGEILTKEKGRAQVQELEAQVSALGAQKSLQEEQLRQVQAVAEQYFAQLADHRRAGEALGAERDRVQGERDALRAELEQAQGERDALRTELEQAQAELTRIYHSKSWRVTEPMRRTRRVLGGQGD